MCLIDHSNHARKMFSVFHDGKTLAVMKPSAQLRGWWILEGRGLEWVNPLARDISAVRAQAGADEWPKDAIPSMYNKTARIMLIKGKRAALAEMAGLARQACTGEPTANVGTRENHVGTHEK